MPVATLVIIALCVAVFILQTLAGGSKNPDVLLDFGASFKPYFQQGQYWRAVMPMFLHIGWWHLLVNMYALYYLGPLLEEMYGYGRFAFIYVLAGISGSLLSIFHSHSVAAGASGAIFGVAGAILVAGSLHREALPYRLARIFSRGRLGLTLLVFVAVQLAFGYLSTNIDNWGHLGGLAGGAILAALIPPPKLPDADGWVAGRSAGAPPLMPGGAPAMGESAPSQAIVWVPVIVVALGMIAAASHYRVARHLSRLLAEGARLQNAKQLDQAFDRYRQAEQLDPRDERSHEELALLDLQAHRLPDAISEFSQALRINPDSIEAQAGLAAAYQESGDLAQAQRVFERLASSNPHSVEIQEELADILAGQKLYQPAIDHYVEALHLSPNLALAHNNLAWLYATADDEKFRNPNAALDHAGKAVELTSWRQPDFIDTLAEAFYVNGNYAEAVKTQAKALQLAPDNKELQEHMARYQKAAQN
ncbi:MAG TPA: rhomboid family intramembrane serine protease [Terriglobia bacterium]